MRRYQCTQNAKCLTQQPLAIPSRRAKQVVGSILADNLSNGATVVFASNNAQNQKPNLRLLMSSASAAGIMSLALPTQAAAGRKCVWPHPLLYITELRY